MIIIDIIFQSGEFFNENSWWSNFFAMLFALIIPFIVLYAQIQSENSRQRREKLQKDQQFYNHFKLLIAKCQKTIVKQIEQINEFKAKFKEDEPSIFRVGEVLSSDLRNFLSITGTPEALNTIVKMNSEIDAEKIFYNLRYSVERSIEVLSRLMETNNQYIEQTQKSIEQLKLKVEESLLFDITDYIRSLKEEKNPPVNINSIEDHLTEYYQLVTNRVKSEEPITSGDLNASFLVPMTHSMVSLLGYSEADQFLDRLRSANWVFASAINNQEEFLKQVDDFKNYLIEDKNELTESLEILN